MNSKTANPPAESLVIFQSNAITEGRYDYSACQLNILFALLASLQKNDPADKVYKIYVKEIQELTGNEWNYTRFAEAAEAMQKQVIMVRKPKGWLTISPFDYIEYKDDGGHIEIRIGLKARPYFFDLKETFTPMQLKSLLTCSSKHAKRIYAMCCQWKGKGKFTISVNELKERLMLKDPKGKFKEQYVEITMMKKQVLNVSKSQINTHSDLNIDYKLIKKGRAFTDIDFTIKKKSSVQPEIDFKMPMEEQIKLQTHTKYLTGYGIREPHLSNLAKAMTESDRIKVAVDEIVIATKMRMSKLEAGESFNTAGYIVDLAQRKGIIK